MNLIYEHVAVAKSREDARSADDVASGVREAASHAQGRRKWLPAQQLRCLCRYMLVCRAASVRAQRYALVRRDAGQRVRRCHATLQSPRVPHVNYEIAMMNIMIDTRPICR